MALTSATLNAGLTDSMTILVRVCASERASLIGDTEKGVCARACRVHIFNVTTESVVTHAVAVLSSGTLLFVV